MCFMNHLDYSSVWQFSVDKRLEVAGDDLKLSGWVFVRKLHCGVEAEQCALLAGYTLCDTLSRRNSEYSIRHEPLQSCETLRLVLPEGRPGYGDAPSPEQCVFL